jgi:hypothetical protein
MRFQVRLGKSSKEQLTIGQLSDNYCSIFCFLKRLKGNNSIFVGGSIAYFSVSK